MVGEPDDRDDLPAFRRPPPPDDRLWRHPSELEWPSRRAMRDRQRRHSPWAAALASGLVGAVLTVGLLSVTGALDRVPERREVVVREAVRPAVTRGSTGSADVVGVVADVAPAVVRIEVAGDEPGVGSGVLFRDDGHLITNAHVVDQARRIDVILSDGREMRGQLVGADRESDIAVVKVDVDEPMPTVVLGSVDDIAVGQRAVAIGSPLGLSGSASVTTGVISALGREIESQDGLVLVDMIQTDAAIAAGSSGGALLDAAGVVIGITTAYAVTDLGAEGLGFATPVDVARAVADDLINFGRVRVVWVGVRAADARDGGVMIQEVMSGGPAAGGGIEPGDILREIGDHPVPAMANLRVMLRRHRPGEVLDVVLERDGETIETKVVLAERPGD